MWTVCDNNGVGEARKKLGGVGNKSTQGFTLIELVIVILILGILSSVAAPSFFGSSSKRAEINAMLAERNAILDAVELYAMSAGQYPADQVGGVFPTELAPYISASSFTQHRPITGTWDWSLTEFGLNASLALADWTADLSLWDEIDSQYDDGDSDTGDIRIVAAYGGHFLVFVVEE